MPLGITGLDPNLLPPAGNATSTRIFLSPARLAGGNSRAQAVSGVAPTPATAPAEPNYRGILSAGPVTPPPAVAELVRNDSATRAERVDAPRASVPASSGSAYEASPAQPPQPARSFRNVVAQAAPDRGPGAAVAASSRPTTVRPDRIDPQPNRTRAEVQAITAYSVVNAPRSLQGEAASVRAVNDAAPSAAAQAANRDRVAIG